MRMVLSADKAFHTGADIDAYAPEEPSIRALKRRARILTIVTLLLVLSIFCFSIPLFIAHATFGLLLLLQLPHLGFSTLAVWISSRALCSSTIAYCLGVISLATLADVASGATRIGFLASCHLSCSSQIVEAFSWVVLVLVILLVLVDIHQLIALSLMFHNLEVRGTQAMRELELISQGKLPSKNLNIQLRLQKQRAARLAKVGSSKSRRKQLQPQHHHFRHLFQNKRMNRREDYHLLDEQKHQLNGGPGGVHMELSSLSITHSSRDQDAHRHLPPQTSMLESLPIPFSVGF